MDIKELVVHTTENGKYKVQFEQAATKGVLGFKVEANSDDIEKCKSDSTELLAYALKRAALVYMPAANGNGNGNQA